MWNFLHQENVSNVIIKYNISKYWRFMTIFSLQLDPAIKFKQHSLYHKIRDQIYVYTFIHFYNSLLTRFLVCGVKWRIEIIIHVIWVKNISTYEHNVGAWVKVGFIPESS